MAARLVRALVAPTSALVLLMGTASGCSRVSDAVSVSTDTGDAAASPPAEAGLTTLTWGALDQTASVLVRNDTDRVLRRGDAIIEALDSSGVVVATSATMPDQGACCTAADVPPGGVFGFYLGVGPHGDEVADVRVDYADTAWSIDSGGPQVTGSPVGLSTDATSTVATADLTTEGGPVAAAVVQARLDDPGGHLVAVVSGVWTCLSPDAPTRAGLQLFHTVPAGTVLASVAVFPILDDAPATDCSST